MELRLIGVAPAVLLDVVLEVLVGVFVPTVLVPLAADEL
jgi:hypothetical protein